MMNFLNYEHKLRFDENKDKMNDHHRINVKYLKVLYILTSSEALTVKMMPFFNEGELRLEEMLKKAELDEREQILVAFANDVLKGIDYIRTNDFISQLNDDEFKVVLEALKFRIVGLQKEYKARPRDIY